MVLPIYVSLEKLDRRLLEASSDLGARPLATFRTVTLPLSMPGVMTGVALVSILLLGEYLIPQMLGAARSISSATRWWTCSCNRATGPSARPSP